jgi:hypothetical protein
MSRKQPAPFRDAMRKLDPELLRWKKSNPNWCLVSFSGRPDSNNTAGIVLHRGTWKECARFANSMPGGAVSDGTPMVNMLAIMPIPAWNNIEKLVADAAAASGQA